MTIKSGTGQACAACKYQRRRCTPECLLAPFFPADQPKMFQNVHRLFGVKNIQNLLKDLGPDHNQKAIAMKSIKFHATMREKHPVYGCMAEIRNLCYQIHMAEEELQAVLHQLAYYRQQQQQQQELSPTTDDYISELQLGMAPPGNTALVHDEDGNSQYNAAAAAFTALPIGPPQVSYSNSSNNADYNINYLDFKEMNSVVNSMCQQTYSNSNDNNPNSIVTHAHLMMQQQQQPLSIHHETTTTSPQDYNEMQPFFDTIDDTQSYIGSKEAYDQSSLSLESSLKDSRQLVEEMDENELKSAAACFSLTSVN